MFFLNLTAGEFLALFGALGGVIAALYLLDRAKRKKLVSTLRFWTPALTAQERQSRKRMREPWSLVLQLVSLLLLLLAVAQLQWGSRGSRLRDHVLLLDTSAWAAERTGRGTLLDREKAVARQYLAALPSRDRVMLVRVDGLATPVTSFTSDRSQLVNELIASDAGFSALNIEQALSFARQAQGWSGAPPGEIVYIGPKLIQDRDRVGPPLPNLRVITVPASRENCGIRRIGVRRSEEDVNSWQATVTLKNYGSERRTVRLKTQFAGTMFALRVFTLSPQEETAAEYNFITNTAGQLIAEIGPADNLSSDDRAVLELPKIGMLRVAAYTDRPDALRPLLEANRRLSVKFFAPSEYDPKPAADVMLLDRMAAQREPKIPSLWIEPPRDHSPLPVNTVVSDTVVKNWHSETALGTGLHAKETRVPSAEVFQTFEGDVPVASVSEGPIVVARSSSEKRAKIAVIGFDPLSGQLRFEVTTPLLFANLLRWLAPEAFRTLDITAGRVGAAAVTLDPSERSNRIRISDEKGFAVPFTVQSQTLQLFASRPGIVHIVSDDRERILSLTLPDIAEFEWKPPVDTATGLPLRSSFVPAAVDLWKWLAILGGLGLLAEWMLFGRSRVWKWWKSANSAGHLSSALKGLSFAAIVLAVAEPVVTMPETKTGAVVLVDTSSSITREDLARASSMISQMERHKHGNWLKVVPFAASARPLSPQELSGGVHLVQTSNEAANGTNLEAALTDSMSAIPSGHMPRLVLISDGNENEGSAARAIAELQRLRVPVDTIPLAGRSNTGLRLESLSMPREAFAGEQIPIDLTVDSPQDAHATIEVSAEGKSLGSNPIELEKGTNLLRVHARVKSTGATSISGRIAAGALGELPFVQAIQLRRAKVLYLSQDPPGTETNLLQALGEANFDLTRDASLIDKDLAAVQLVVLNNLDLNVFAARQKTHLEEYVKNGGGLLLIGGERQVYKDDKQMDALDRVLPAKLAPPKTPQGTCVALIIDKSSSMEGRKIELARLSASGVVDHLRPMDTIGVLIFDNSFQWAVPMRRAEDKSLIKRLISGITPDGGTQIAPALTEAYRKVLSSKANYKHIVLLTDGISEEGDSMELAKEALEHQVTISTVGLGQDVNRTYLEKVAQTSGGRSYFLNEPQGLEQILLKDVQDYSGSTAVEKPLTPIVERQAEILDGVDIDTAPPLKGYARFVAKPTAETILAIDQEKKDPLYVRWQYGLGRAAVFASDAKSRWAQSWVAWPGFDKFWLNVTRDLLTHADRSEASAQLDTANDDILVGYRLGAALDEPLAPPEIFVIGPNHFERIIDVQKTAPRVYQGRLHVGRLRGLFRIRPVVESPAFPEIGLYRQEEELRDYGSNEALLAQISTLTGGRFNPPPSSIFDEAGRSIYTPWQLWPGLLGLAIALTIAELVARKWSGLVQGFRKA